MISVQSKDFFLRFFHHSKGSLDTESRGGSELASGSEGAVECGS